MSIGEWQPETFQQFKQRRHEYSVRGGQGAAAALGESGRQWRARRGAAGSRTPMAHARALAKQWPVMTDEARERVWSELADLLRWAHEPEPDLPRYPSAGQYGNTDYDDGGSRMGTG